MSAPGDFDPNRTQVILSPGSQAFGRYVLTELVGEGGMGVVWRARDEKLDRDVALKFLPERVRRDPEAVRDLKRETRRCLDLTHPNIVRVYDFVEDGFATAIAMEFVPGKSLSALKAARPTGCFDAADLAPLVRQLAAALDYAHTQGQVVHRDLKPANLLVTAEGMLKIADFGISRSMSETATRQTGDLRGTSGTLAFMGPQQLLNKRAAPSDDVYALGATLYDLLTGKPPFFAGDIFMQVRHEPPEPMAERRQELGNTGAAIPPAWEHAIFSCLAKEAEARPASAGAVLALLEGGGGEPPVLVEKSLAPPAKVATEERGLEPRTAPSRRGLWLGLAGAGGFALLAVLALFFWKRGKPPTLTVLPPEKVQAAAPAVEKPPLPRTGQLAVRAEPNEITLTVNGRAVQPEEMQNGELTLSAGEASALVASAAGYRPQARTFTLAAGRRDVWEVRLEKMAGPELRQAWTVPGLGLAVQPVGAGTFAMGAPDDEPGRYDEDGPLTTVKITRPFWLGRTEVTHAQWRTLMGSDLRAQAAKALADDTPYMFDGTRTLYRDAVGLNRDDDPARIVVGEGDALPMTFVSWDEAAEFCRALTRRERAAGRVPAGYEYRLPTEAEWEYACRAGTTEATYAGPLRLKGRNHAPVLDEIAWYGGNSSVGYSGRGVDTKKWSQKQYPGGVAGPRDVATKRANPWGLHDMLGNAFEWCLDEFQARLTGGAVTDPLQPPVGALRVYRGGGWSGDAAHCRAANRVWNEPGVRGNLLGFRVALAPEVSWPGKKR